MIRFAYSGSGQFLLGIEGAPVKVGDKVLGTVLETKRKSNWVFLGVKCDTEEQAEQIKMACCGGSGVRFGQSQFSMSGKVFELASERGSNEVSAPSSVIDRVCSENSVS